MNSFKDFLRPVFFYCGLPYAKARLRRTSAQRLVFILMYHRVDYKTPPFYCVVHEPGVFEKQIIFLKKYFNIIGFEDIGGIDARCKKDFVIITFDDGYRDNYMRAFPILKKHQVPATVFLATGFISTNDLLWYDKLAWILNRCTSVPGTGTLVKNGIEQDLIRDLAGYFNASAAGRAKYLNALALKLRLLPQKKQDDILCALSKACHVCSWPDDQERAMLSWDEVREMSKYKISFGAHTRSHPALSLLSLSEARTEIEGSKRDIEEKIQKPVSSFAYPYGKTEDYNDGIVQLVKGSGYKYACTTNSGSERLPFGSPYSLRRKGTPLGPCILI